MNPVDFGALILGLIAAAAILLCLYGIAWLLFSRSELSEDKIVNAKVVATRYQPHRTHTHVGTTVGANGQIGTTVLVEDDEEEDIVLLRSAATGRIKIDNADLLDTVMQGEEVELTYKEKYTYWTWNRNNKSFDSYVPVLVKTKNGDQIKL